MQIEPSSLPPLGASCSGKEERGLEKLTPDESEQPGWFTQRAQSLIVVESDLG